MLLLSVTKHMNVIFFGFGCRFILMIVIKIFFLILSHLPTYFHYPNCSHYPILFNPIINLLIIFNRSFISPLFLILKEDLF